MGGQINRTKGPKTYTHDTAGEIRTYAGERWFCRNPSFENVFIVPVSGEGEEYRGDEGRTIPRKVWSGCKICS